jgi:hypothetical protein
MDTQPNVVPWSRFEPHSNVGSAIPDWLVWIPRECWRRNRILSGTSAALLLVVLPPLLALALYDPRILAGQNVWIKPIKFTLSFSLYFITLGWLLSYLPASRSVTRIAWITSLAILFEAPILILQAARGVPSHFNTSTPGDTALFYLMGAAAFTQVGMLAWSLLIYHRSPVALPPLVAQGVRVGMATLLLGMLPGLAMIALNQHSVGFDDAGANLPILRWNTAGGDLRIAHFLGLHALQILPLAAAALTYFDARFAAHTGPLAFRWIASLYILTLLGTFAQALYGQPLIPAGWLT